MPYPTRVRVYEVGPRDGLQNESTAVSTATKIEYIRRLSSAGLTEIEATSFVSPKAVPQLADGDVLLPQLPDRDRVRYPVLVPNERGMNRAEAAGANAVAVFTAASESFTRANIGMTIAESIEAFRPVLARAAQRGMWTRGYVSTAFGCPFSGAVDPAAAVEVSLRLVDIGADEICLGDTIGVGVPSQVHDLSGRLLDAGISLDRLAYHFHDTRGTALANVAAGLEDGISCFDASSGGTGGCPYAPGAAGNLATEDLVNLLDAMGIETGVSLERVLDAARFIANALGKPLTSKVGQAGGWDPATGAATFRVA
jgi:isopropylmalate/homocitrate/citramalate synthase